MQNKKKSRLRTVLLILVCVSLLFIWGNSLLDGEQSTELSNVFSDRLGNVFQSLTDAMLRSPLSPVRSAGQYLQTQGVSFAVRKAAHFSEFALFGIFLTAFAFTGAPLKLRFPFVLLCGLPVAVIDETIQQFTSRTSSLADARLDYVGYLFGMAIGLIIHACRNRRKNKRKKTKEETV